MYVNRTAESNSNAKKVNRAISYLLRRITSDIQDQVRNFNLKIYIVKLWLIQNFTVSVWLFRNLKKIHFFQNSSFLLLGKFFWLYIIGLAFFTLDFDSREDLYKTQSNLSNKISLEIFLKFLFRLVKLF